MRILIQVLHVRVGRCAVEIEVVFLYVLSVIAFAAGQSKDALLENRIALIPKRQGKADLLVSIADAGDSVFVPAISA